MTNLSRERSIPKVFASLLDSIRGTSLRASAIRGMSWTVIGYGGSQALRLVSNLILTRLFMPEVFGIMALVHVCIQCLAMLSDSGIQAAVIQSTHGDEPKFLNTAWTIGVLRGFALWAATCALGYPISLIYSAPELAVLVPAVGMTAAISGLQPTKALTANRHLQLGRLTAIELISQVLGIFVIMLLAIWIRSAWAMALGAIANSVFHVVLVQKYLSGIHNRFEWCSQSSDELFRFGRWIFVGSIAGFLINQGDRLVLGFYISLDQLGIYNIGWFLGSVPLALAMAISRQVLLPVYGKQDPKSSRRSYTNILRTRTLLSCVLVPLAVATAYVGPFFVDLLYSDNYGSAGIVVTLVGLATIPKIVLIANESALLGRGDSKSFTLLLVASGFVQIVGFLLLVPPLGVFGIVISLALSPIMLYPFMARLVRGHGAWMPGHDISFVSLGVFFGAGALFVHKHRLLIFLADYEIAQW